MFTGIVEEVGQVASLSDYRLVIQAKTVLEDVHVGDSISVNGACLTVVEFNYRLIRGRSGPGNTAPDVVGTGWTRRAQ